MQITRRHPFTGKSNTVDLDITPEQFARWESGEVRHVQDAFPHLSADDREFLVSGLVPGEFDDLFPENDEDGDDE